MRSNFFAAILVLISLAAGALPIPRDVAPFHALNADEYEVRFDAVFRTDWTQLEQVRRLNERQKNDFKDTQAFLTLKYLYGPLTHREWGSPQRGFQINIDWGKATVERNRVYVPYSYKATWILHREIAGNRSLQIPVPYNSGSLMTRSWKACTDSQADHQTPSFFWYFWDPERRGCDHRLGEEYQMVPIHLGRMTVNQKNTYPEYARMIRRGPGGERRLTMTFAFGYVDNPADPQPETDPDMGAQEYQDFLNWMRQSTDQSWEEKEIKLKEYGPQIYPEKVIGHRFSATKSGIKVIVSVVAAAGIDQMDLFAKSFAEDHESFFAWFGHSRVGDGFDAEVFANKVKREPRRYSISRDYQLLYWGGCNSYSYYTLPFFQLKANQQDPLGTKSLDIISNGLPSYFVLNAANAKVIFKHLYNWEKRPSYQMVIRDLEAVGSRRGMSRVLINVLGDEDNINSLR